MAKKILVRATVSKKNWWYIDYTVYNLVTGENKRRRRDFDLNDIQDLAVRALVADRIARNIEVFVGADLSGMAPITQKQMVPLADAITQALRVKLASPRKNTHKGYKSISKQFLAWAAQCGLIDADINVFTKKHAHAFFDYLNELRKYRGTTLNNYLIHLKALWSEAIERELCEKNPWTTLKPAPKSDKLRRPFSEDEKRVVATEILETDYWMFKALLLQYYCFIRPGEITRLKFKNFDLARGLIHIERAQAKNWKERWATIPKSIIPLFLDGVFEKQPANWYMLGYREKQLQPAPVAIGDNRMYKRHKKVLERLLKAGKLRDINGLVWYSWKDTGITDHAQKTSPLATKDQAGHHDISMTMLYYHTPKINGEYRDLVADLVYKKES